MAKRFQLTRRLHLGMTEQAWRRLKRFAADSGLSEEDALSFLFESFDSVTKADKLVARTRLFTAELAARKRQSGEPEQE